jgi:tetratricopeptide (TPR) repeat protein
MKKIVLVLAIVLSLSAQTTFAQNGQLANANKPGLYVRSLDEVLRLQDDEMDLATATLIASEYWSDMVEGRRYLEQLDEMALEIQARLRRQRIRGGHRAIPIINDYLFNELGFKAISHADDPNDLFLHSVMDRRQGYCLSLSVLYLSVAERLGLKVYGVVVPGHFFVRYDAGRTRFNIETTSNGATPSDDHYITKFKIGQSSRDTIYMKNLTKRQTLGCFFNNLGNVYNDIGDSDTAQLALERAVAINPTLSESRANLGNIYLKKGRVEEAIRQYRAAIELNPNDPKAHNNIGNAYLELDRLDFAAMSYRDALALDPEFTDAHRNLALAFTRQGRYPQALAQVKQAIGITPRDTAIHNQLAELYCRMGQYDDAISAYSKAIRLNGKSAEAHYGLALCYREQGNAAAEIRSYRNALSVNPNMLPALADLGSACFSQGNYDSAIQYYLRAAQLQPDDAWIHRSLGAAYSKKGKASEAIRTFLIALRLDPSTAGETYCDLARCYRQLAQPDKEIWAYENALLSDPDQVVALVGLGNAHFNKEDYDTAVQFFERAAKLKPQDASIHYNIGAAFSNGGNFTKAILSYRRTIEIDPDFAEAHQNLAYSYYMAKKYDLAWKHIGLARKLHAKVPEELVAAVKRRL